MSDIRRAQPGDLQALIAIEDRCFGVDAFSPRQLAYLIAHAQGTCLVLEVQGHVEGYISLLARRGAGNLRIYSVAVAPQAQGIGAGQALLDAAIAEARQHNLRAVTLEVRTDNTPAITLYTKNGFRPGKLLRDYYHDGADGRQMTLRLSSDR